MAAIIALASGDGADPAARIGGHILRAVRTPPTDSKPDCQASRAASPAIHLPGNFAQVVSRLSGVQAVIILSALVTGPITARTLGVHGRGELAAIVALLTVIPWLLDLGLSQWLARERALGGGLPELLGAALPVALGCSLIGVAAAIPLAHILGQGRPTVITYMEIGLFLAPVTVGLRTLIGLAIGESLWRLVATTGVLASAIPAAAIVALAATSRLTVATAAAAYLVGGLASSAVLLPVLRGTRRLMFDRARSRAAAAFGTKSWLSTVASVSNLRLDQVLMAALVTTRELGLYAVAVSIASVTSGMSSAVSNALYPRVARGDAMLAARSCRVTAGIAGIAALMLGALSPPLVPFVFGSEFANAVPMLVVLLLAGIPLAAATVLASALNAANDPASTMRAELTALSCTIPALIILLPASGGLAAAAISLVAYSLRLAMLLRSATRVFGGGARTFLVPTRGDLAWVWDQARRRAGAVNA